MVGGGKSGRPPLGLIPSSITCLHLITTNFDCIEEERAGSLAELYNQFGGHRVLASVRITIHTGDGDKIRCVLFIDDDKLGLPEDRCLRNGAAN